MGCDIHAYVERNVNGKWVTTREVTENFGDRDYSLFAVLAGVRGPGPDPLGLPDDVADTTQLHSDDWGIDGHSHSYVSAKEAVAMYRLLHPDVEHSDAYVDMYYRVLGLDAAFDRDSPDKHRVVFWFDN